MGAALLAGKVEVSVRDRDISLGNSNVLQGYYMCSSELIFLTIIYIFSRCSEASFSSVVQYFLVLLLFTALSYPLL